MTLHKKIRQKLSEVSQDNILKKMQYSSLRTGRKTMKKFLACRSIYEWLRDGNYDLTYGSKTFLLKLTTALGLDGAEVVKEIEKAQERLAITEKMTDPGITAETEKDIRSIAFPVFIFAYRKGSVHFSKEEFADLSREESFEKVGKEIRRNYENNNGKLGVLGAITGYTYKHTDGKEYLFDIDGNSANDNTI